MSVYNIYNDITSYADIFYIYITDFYILYILYKTIYVIYNINILYIYIYMYVCMYVTMHLHGVLALSLFVDENSR